MLQKAINEGLDQLGGPIGKTIAWHLRANGIFIESKADFDLRDFQKHLEEIIGNIAVLVMNEVYENLKRRCPDYTESTDSNLELVDRIDRLLASQTGGDTAC